MDGIIETELEDAAAEAKEAVDEEGAGMGCITSPEGGRIGKTSGGCTFLEASYLLLSSCSGDSGGEFEASPPAPLSSCLNFFCCSANW